MDSEWRLSTFNMESLDAKPSDPDGFARRCSALRPILQRLCADVLCLQEINAQHAPGRKKERRFTALRDLLAGTDYADFHIATSANPRTGRPADVHNLAVLSKWPIRRSWQIFHDLIAPIDVPAMPEHADDNKHEKLFWDRPILCCEIDMPDGRPLFVLTMHLRAPRAAPLQGFADTKSATGNWAVEFYLAALKRQGQALEARLAVEGIFNSDERARIAICGDLNSDIYETPSRLLSAQPEDTGISTLHNRSLIALETKIAADNRYSVIHNGRRILLDHILTSQTLATNCTGAELHNSDLEDEFLADKVATTSFHAPLLARFAFD